MAVPTRRILDPIFGKPTLYSRNNSKASWDRATAPLDQKSSTGWLAALYGGVQTGDDYARLNIPVNEMRVPDLKSALWSYYMSTSDSFGVNIVIWLHDPNDFDNRAEVTQAADTALLIKTAGWNAHELDITTDQFYWYGEDDAAAVASGLTEGIADQYGWEDFQADALFSTWTIYRITFEFGWQASGTFGIASVADVKLNGQMIPMGPAVEWRGQSQAKNSGVLCGNTAVKTSAGEVFWLTVSDTAALAIELNDHPSGSGTDRWAIDLPADGYGHFIFDPPIPFDNGIYLDVSTVTCLVTIGYK